jgi:hypothetical protein
MSEHFMSTLKLDLKHSSSQNDFHDTLDLDRLIIAIIINLLFERASSAFSSCWFTSS